MLKEFKYSVWYIGGKLFLVYIFSMIINLIVLTGFVNVVKDSEVWGWVVTGVTMIIHYSIIYLFITIDGRRDIQIDSANEKRKERNADFIYTNKFDVKKGFIAGAIAQIPIAGLYIAWLITNSSMESFNIIEFLVRTSFSHYYLFLSKFGLNPLAVITYILIYIAVAGVAYMRAKTYRKKVLTIIKRNKEKAIQKGIINN